MALHLRFRPDDPTQPPIESRSVPTNNLLLKITIPRRRRKKRRAEDGADEANRADGASSSPKEMTLPEKLKAAKGNYKVEAIGRVEKTVRFRGWLYVHLLFFGRINDGKADMASFQWNSSNSDFINKMKDKLMEGDCMQPYRPPESTRKLTERPDEKIRSFELSKDRGDPDSEILPPPTFSNTVIPHTYLYADPHPLARVMTLMSLQKLSPEPRGQAGPDRRENLTP